MKNSEVLSMLVKAKLAVAERVISFLPEEIRPMVKEAEETVLTVFRDEISLHLRQEAGDLKDKSLRKVDVE